jgi:DNA-binding IclR family transcriptional regulator
VAKRNATILQLLAENPEGLSKPQLATELREKEANVYTSLRRLQSDGKVRMENTEGTKYLWYLV